MNCPSGMRVRRLGVDDLLATWESPVRVHGTVVRMHGGDAGELEATRLLGMGEVRSSHDRHPMTVVGAQT